MWLLLVRHICLQVINGTFVVLYGSLLLLSSDFELCDGKHLV